MPIHFMQMTLRTSELLASIPLYSVHEADLEVRVRVKRTDLKVRSRDVI